MTIGYSAIAGSVRGEAKKVIHCLGTRGQKKTGPWPVVLPCAHRLAHNLRKLRTRLWNRGRVFSPEQTG